MAENCLTAQQARAVTDTVVTLRKLSQKVDSLTHEIYNQILIKSVAGLYTYIHRPQGTTHWLPAWGQIADTLRAGGFKVVIVYADGRTDIKCETDKGYPPQVVNLTALYIQWGEPTVPPRPPSLNQICQKAIQPFLLCQTKGGGRVWGTLRFPSPQKIENHSGRYLYFHIDI